MGYIVKKFNQHSFMMRISLPGFPHEKPECTSSWLLRIFALVHHNGKNQEGKDCSVGFLVTYFEKS